MNIALENALLGGHILGDAVINSEKYAKLLHSVIKHYNPDDYSVYRDAYYACAITEESLNELYKSLDIASFDIDTELRAAQDTIDDIYINNTITEKHLNVLTESINIIKTNIEFNKNTPVDIFDLPSIVSKPKVYSSGIEYLDTTIGTSGFEEGRCYVFASKAKGGKSIFL